MKFLVVLALAVACASGSDVPQYVRSDEYNAPIVKSVYDISPEGNFNYNYETGNGISAIADGTVKNYNSEYPAVEIKGAFKYTSPEGGVIETVYTADENGYHPQGNHLPVSPPIPELIARSLAYIASQPAAIQAAAVKKA